MFSVRIVLEFPARGALFPAMEQETKAMIRKPFRLLAVALAFTGAFTGVMAALIVAQAVW